MTRHGLARALGAALLLGALTAACGEPPEKRPSKVPKCPPPPEPAYQSVVVGTIGKLHLVESRYPLTRLGDVLAAFKPDLVLLAVRVDPYREGHLEDGSFEMTYVHHVARQRGVEVEPIDWFREQDLGAPLPPVDPWDETEIAKREADVLGVPRLFTFEQANAPELEQKVFLAVNAEARHRGGNPLVTRRQAWVQGLVASAVTRHDRPRRVLAYVDVFDRPTVDLATRALGYDPRTPADVVARSKDAIVPDVPSEVVAEWKGQLDRARANAAKAEGAAKAFWAERERALEVAVERKGSCCVTQAALAPR
jgi:hypothetical protein